MTTTTTQTDPLGDLFDPRAYAQGAPYDVYARLRAEAPVSWHEEPAVLGWPAGPGFWAVTRYDDVQHVSRTPGTYSAWLGCTQLRDPAPEDLDFTRQMMLNMDPPVHNRLRKTVSKAFTPARIRHFTEMIRTRAKVLVDAVCERGECDFAQDIADELPLVTLAEIMGVPESDRHLLFMWANRVIGYQDEELGSTSTGAQPARPPVNPRSRAALQDMFDYAHQLAEFKRANPADDLITTLVHAEVDGRPLSDEEFELFFFLLSVAGNDTTRSAIPAGVLAFIQHPDQRRRLVEDPSRLPGAVEEVLRYCPPVVHFRRTATEDVELRGARINRGDKVVVFYPAANRDPEVFADPDRFDITRTPNNHVSFGFGPHICLGAGFARLQITHTLSEVLNRMPEMELAGAVERIQSNFILGIKRMPVRFQPTRR
ncbi:MAG: cytochrome P450 [Geodermatophilaceae bacterium]|nr:cytochrome P450 [Geodermatophilaceae bacterium]